MRIGRSSKKQSTPPEAISFINERPKPLALYCFGNRRSCRTILGATSSGSACVNDCVMQLCNPHMPFGGVGASGSGVFDMNGIDLTVPELVGEGGLVSGGTLTVTERAATESFVQVDDVVLSGATFASNGENYLKALSSAEGSIVVDFGRDESDPLPRGYAVKVAEIPSSSSLYVTGVNTGRPGRWEITGERRNEADGVVEIWAVLKPLGTTLILR